MDFRERQCSQFNGKHFNIHGLSNDVKWVAKYSGSKYYGPFTHTLRCAALRVAALRW